MIYVYCQKNRFLVGSKRNLHQIYCQNWFRNVYRVIFQLQKNCLDQGQSLRNHKNFDLKNYSACSRKLFTFFSLIYCFNYYVHIICSIAINQIARFLHFTDINFLRLGNFKYFLGTSRKKSFFILF